MHLKLPGLFSSTVATRPLTLTFTISATTLSPINVPPLFSTTIIKGNYFKIKDFSKKFIQFIQLKCISLLNWSVDFRSRHSRTLGGGPGTCLAAAASPSRSQANPCIKAKCAFLQGPSCACRGWASRFRFSFSSAQAPVGSPVTRYSRRSLVPSSPNNSLLKINNPI